MSSNEGHRGGATRVGLLLIEPPGMPAAATVPAIADELARTGMLVRCLQPASPGGDGEQGARWRQWYAEAEAALAALRRDCDVVVVGGTSVGAALGLLLAANHPKDVHATALLAPTLWLEGRLTPRVARLVCLALGRRAAEAIGLSSWLPQEPGVPTDVLTEHGRLLSAARRSLKAVSQPTLIVHARADCCAGLDSAGYLQRHLRGLVDLVVLGSARDGTGLARQQGRIVEKAALFIETAAKRARALASAPATVRVLKAA